MIEMIDLIYIAIIWREFRSTNNMNGMIETSLSQSDQSTQAGVRRTFLAVEHVLWDRVLPTYGIRTSGFQVSRSRTTVYPEMQRMTPHCFQERNRLRLPQLPT